MRVWEGTSDLDGEAIKRISNYLHEVDAGFRRIKLGQVPIGSGPPLAGVTSHHLLTDLATYDDHPQYLLLNTPGGPTPRAGGQIIYGQGTNENTLSLQESTAATGTPTGYTLAFRDNLGVVRAGAYLDGSGLVVISPLNTVLVRTQLGFGVADASTGNGEFSVSYSGVDAVVQNNGYLRFGHKAGGATGAALQINNAITGATGDLLQFSTVGTVVSYVTAAGKVMLNHASGTPRAWLEIYGAASEQALHCSPNGAGQTGTCIGIEQTAGSSNYMALIKWNGVANFTTSSTVGNGPGPSIRTVQIQNGLLGRDTVSNPPSTLFVYGAGGFDLGNDNTSDASAVGASIIKCTSGSTVITPATLRSVVTFNSGHGLEPTAPRVQIDGSTSQSGNLLELRNSTGTVLSYFDSTGAFFGAAGGSAAGWNDDGTVVRLTTATDQVAIGTASPTGTNQLYLKSSANGTVTLRVDQKSGQTAHLLDVIDASATTLFSLDSAGAGTVNTTWTAARAVNGLLLCIDNGFGGYGSGGFAVQDVASGWTTELLCSTSLTGNIAVTLPNAGGTLLTSTNTTNVQNKTLIAGTIIECNTIAKFSAGATTTKGGQFDFTLVTAATFRQYDWQNFSAVVPLVGKTATAAAAGTLAGIDVTGKAADIAATNLTTSAAAGQFLIIGELAETAVDATAGAVSLVLTWTDDSGARTKTFGPITLTAVGTSVVDIDQPCYLASGNIAFSTTHTGIFGTATYAVRLRVIALN